MKKICSLLLLLLVISYCEGKNDASANEQPKIIKPHGPQRWPYIRCTLQDRSGNIWFGTSDQGVYRYNGRTFANFTKLDGLINNDVVTMMEDKAGNIWFGTAGGACRYDGKTFTNIPLPGTDGANFFTSIGAADLKNKGTRRTKTILSIVEDKKGILWFGMNDGVYRYDAKLSPDARVSITHLLTVECPVSDYPENDLPVGRVFEDSKGAIWFSSGKCGNVYRLDASRAADACISNSCKHNLQLPQDLAAHNRELATCFVKMNTNEGADIIAAYDIIEDKKGNIWLSTSDSGVYRYDGKFITHFSKNEGMLNTFVSAMFEDKAGNMWFGTMGRCSSTLQDIGTYRYDGKTLTHYIRKEGLTSDGVVCFAEDKAGNILIGTNGSGVYSINPSATARKDGKMIFNYNEYDGLGSVYIRSTITDKNGNVWFGTMDLGVSRYKENDQPGGKGSFINYTTTDAK